MIMMMTTMMTGFRLDYDMKFHFHEKKEKINEFTWPAFSYDMQRCLILIIPSFLFAISVFIKYKSTPAAAKSCSSNSSKSKRSFLQSTLSS
jgi:hypothetical protein